MNVSTWQMAQKNLRLFQELVLGCSSMWGLSFFLSLPLPPLLLGFTFSAQWCQTRKEAGPGPLPSWKLVEQKYFVAAHAHPPSFPYDCLVVAKGLHDSMYVMSHTMQGHPDGRVIMERFWCKMALLEEWEWQTIPVFPVLIEPYMNMGLHRVGHEFSITEQILQCYLAT